MPTLYHTAGRALTKVAEGTHYEIASHLSNTYSERGLLSLLNGTPGLQDYVIADFDEESRAPTLAGIWAEADPELWAPNLRRDNTRGLREFLVQQSYGGAAKTPLTAATDALATCARLLDAAGIPDAMAWASARNAQVVYTMLARVTVYRNSAAFNHFAKTNQLTVKETA